MEPTVRSAIRGVRMRLGTPTNTAPLSPVNGSVSKLSSAAPRSLPVDSRLATAASSTTPGPPTEIRTRRIRLSAARVRAVP